MKRGQEPCVFYGKNKKFVGFALGSDYAAEHECGTKELRETLGLNPEAPAGIERRRVQQSYNLGKQLKLVETPDHTVLFLDEGGMVSDERIANYRELAYFQEDQQLVGAWDSGSFGIAAKGKGREYLRELHQAFLHNDVAFGGQLGKAFQGSGIRFFILSRLPYHALKTAENADLEYDSRQRRIRGYCDAVDFDGVKKKLRAAGKRWFALKADELRDGTTQFWLNPEDQRNNAAGWMTIEDLRDWAEGKGRIVMKQA